MPTKAVTDQSFESDVIKSKLPTVVDFWAEWCGPCKQIGPILEEISNEMKDKVTIAKHNIDNEPNTPTKYGIRGIPTMLLFKGGELKATKVGATTKSNIIDWIKENIQLIFKKSPQRYKEPKTHIIFFSLLLDCSTALFIFLTTFALKLYFLAA